MKDTELPSLEVIVTAHKEGTLLLPTVKSAFEAVKCLHSKYDVDVNYMLYLDKPDAITKKIAMDIKMKYGIKVYFGKNGDPGRSRLAAINKTKQKYIALLDGDDLWSENWLLSVYRFLAEKSKKERKNIVLHPEYNLIFGDHSVLVRQGEPSDPFFDPSFFRIGNFWDALCFAPIKVFIDYPYKDNDLDAGFAHEDYLWACETYLAGVKHHLIKDTIHFKRRRGGSVSVVAESKKVKVMPTALSKYKYYTDSHKRKEN